MPLRVAVIDDNPADSKLIRMAIHRSDPQIDVITLDDGRQALNFFASPSRPVCGLVLLDLNIPGVSGFEVLEHLKSDPAYKSIPMVILSGSSNSEDVNRCYQLGANSYHCKAAAIAEVFTMAEEIVRYWFHVSLLPTIGCQEKQ